MNYAGWNRQTSTPPDYNAFVIHHPKSEDMRITTVSNIRNWLWNNMFWTAHYSLGTVTNGSSGSALMNEYGQVIGQLRSGWSGCNGQSFGDRYGKFYHSWNGAGLQQWLSPNQGLQSTGLLNLTDIPITGPSIIACTTPTEFYTVPGLLDVTYTWTVSAGLQIISGQGTPNVIISGLSNNQYGYGTLTLTLNSPTKGRIRTYTVSKNITINTGGNSSVSGTYISPTSNTQPLVPIVNKFDLTTYNPTCLAFMTNMSIPSGATVTWEGSTSSPYATWYQSGNDLVCYFTAVDDIGDFVVRITTSCGTAVGRYRFKCVSATSCGGINPLRVSLSPNPATSSIQVSLEEKADKTRKRDLQEIRVVDKQGIIKFSRKYGPNQKLVNLDISNLHGDIYTVLVYDGQTWIAERFIKN